MDGAGRSSDPASSVVDEIRSAGGQGLASFDSVADFKGAGRIVETALDGFGRVDILCHAAGILRDRMVFNMTEDEWDGVLRVHLIGAFNMVRNAAPHMMEQAYGRVVLFSSISALGAAGQANYAAAKEGMVGFCPRPCHGARPPWDSRERGLSRREYQNDGNGHECAAPGPGVLRRRRSGRAAILPGAS